MNHSYILYLNIKIVGEIIKVVTILEACVEYTNKN